MKFFRQLASRFLSRVELFYTLVAIAVVTRVVCDVSMGRLEVHNGEFYAYRGTRFETYGTGWLVAEWFFLLASAVLMTREKYRRIGSCILIIAISASLTQMFQHQKILFLIVGAAIFFDPLAKPLSSSNRFLKIQLLIIYFFSSAAKVFTEFPTNGSLTVALQQSIESSAWRAGVFAVFTPLDGSVEIFLGWSAVVLEIVIALLLVVFPFAGFMVAVLFHSLMAVALADVLPFSILSVALASLFLPNRPSEKD